MPFYLYNGKKFKYDIFRRVSFIVNNKLDIYIYIYTHIYVRVLKCIPLTQTNHACFFSTLPFFMTMQIFFFQSSTLAVLIENVLNFISNVI